MNKIIPFCPKCEKPLTYVNQGYLTVVESGGPSHDGGAIAYAWRSDRCGESFAASRAAIKTGAHFVFCAGL
jgi:hypothetical protein